jgi:LPS sulfotransferase NodH
MTADTKETTEIAIQLKDIQQTNENIFFIVGTSRSGSTLLQSMLNTHSKITIPPETHFFHSLSALLQWNKRLEPAEFRSRLIDFWYRHKTRLRDLGLDQQQIRKQAEQLELSEPIDLFSLQLTAYRMQRGKEVVGEKTPRHIRHIDQILSYFPQAKIISLFRDPRATANSEINAQFGSPSVMITTQRWREYVELHHQYQQRLPEDIYMMTRYRDLIDDPAGTLEHIINHLGYEFEEEMLQYYRRDQEEQGFAPGEMDWKNETLEPLKTNKNESWKTELSDWQVAIVEETAGSWLPYMGYDAQMDKMNVWKRILYSGLDWSRSAVATILGSRNEGYQEPGRFSLKNNS